MMAGEDTQAIERRRQLDMVRDQEMTSEPEEGPKPKVPVMTWKVFVLSLLLMIIQSAVIDISAATGAYYVLGWLAGALISIILWILLRKYRRSMKWAKVALDTLLAADLFPVIDVIMSIIPIDIVLLIYIFASSRKHQTDMGTDE